MVVDKITPRSNFETRKVKGFRVPIDSQTYTIVDGWGIWDKSACAFVAMMETIEDVRAKTPMTFRTKKIASLAYSEGLIAGYPTF